MNAKRRARAEGDAATGTAGASAIIRTPLLTDKAALGRARGEYARSTPYTHSSIRGLCDEAHLAAAKEEIVRNLRATFKETDLFKVLQVPLDLACLEQSAPAVAAKMPALLALRDALYSREFREMLRGLTGCGPLSEKTDCSVNIYAPGHHLLCHDDVIGTRRLSYIVYLTEPGRDWRLDEGGALELYGTLPPDASGVAHPHTTPMRYVLPHWNSMALFEVQPGRSFHSVGEVLGECPRMSISGWFHRPHDEPMPPGAASLAQLRGVAAGADATAPAEPFEPLLLYAADAAEGVRPTGASLAQLLTGPERRLLERWLNPTYLEPKALAKIQAQFATHSCMQLRGFLRDDVAGRIAELTRAADASDAIGTAPPDELFARLCGKHDLGVRDGWHVVGPPHMQRFLRYDHPPHAGRTSGARASEPLAGESDVGNALAQLRATLVTSPAFQKYLLALTQLRTVGARSAIRRFRPGLDYTVAHAGAMPPRDCPFLDATFCFVHEGQPHEEQQAGRARRADGAAPRKKRRAQLSVERAAWQSGEVGGFEAYLGAEEDNDPEVTAVYRTSRAPERGSSAPEAAAGASAGEDARGETEEGAELLNVEASTNTLNLVLRDSGTLRFVKYVSARAPGSRWDVAVEYRLHPADVPSGESDGEGDNEGEEEEGEDGDDGDEDEDDEESDES
ncbi:hypothetical protein KFE25_008770 [Diacronema lutheri]|uniref:Fe2OG dioxygenase domain-containing protein n=1 Tax=Diacronema lutheri TaxID=2081491 RepID=A0A8J6CF56_DIALT|nr:hypothetical protein KFE25_008770 [Diacronema lutheri]